MLFSSFIIAVASVAAVSASPIQERQATLCTGTENNAVCCATDVLGLADLNCAAPPTTPTNVTDFINICSAEGQQAKCCLLPILDQALVCADPVGA